MNEHEIFAHVPKEIFDHERRQLNVRAEQLSIEMQANIKRDLAKAANSGFVDENMTKSLTSKSHYPMQIRLREDYINTLLTVLYKYDEARIPDFRKFVTEGLTLQGEHPPQLYQTYPHTIGTIFDNKLAALKAEAFKKREEAEASSRNDKIKGHDVDSPTPIAANDVTEVEFIKEIGQGQSAHVWLVRDPQLDRQLAVKLLIGGGDTEKRTVDHARALAKAVHPNVVTVHRLAKVRHPKSKEIVDAIILEFLDGKTLFERQNDGKSTAAEAKLIGEAVINGIQHIHAQGLEHGDLHEGNIMVCSNHVVKVLDIAFSNPLDLLSTETRQMRLRRDINNLKRILGGLVAQSDLDAALLTTHHRQLQDAKELDDVRRVFSTILDAKQSETERQSRSPDLAIRQIPKNDMSKPITHIPVDNRKRFHGYFAFLILALIACAILVAVEIIPKFRHEEPPPLTLLQQPISSKFDNAKRAWLITLTFLPNRDASIPDAGVEVRFPRPYRRATYNVASESGMTFHEKTGVVGDVNSAHYKLSLTELPRNASLEITFECDENMPPSEIIVTPGAKSNASSGAASVTNNATAVIDDASLVTKAIQDAAHADSRKAFDQLREWAKNPNFSEQRKAADAVRTLIAENNSWSFQNEPRLSDDAIKVLDEKPFEDIRSELFKSTTNGDYKYGLISYISHDNRVSKKLKLQCFIDLINVEPSIRNTKQAIRYLHIQTKQDFPMLDIDAVLDWWGKNKDSIKE